MIFQTDRYAGVIPIEQWDEYVYDNEITPIRVCITEITDKWIKQLHEILTSDKEQYLDIILEEMNKSDFTFYSN